MLIIIGGLFASGVILYSIKLISDNYSKRQEEERSEMIRERDEEHEREKQEKAKLTEEITTEEEVIELTPEEMEAKYWEEEWVNPVATPADAVFNYTYHKFEYTDNTVELKPYMEVFEEVKADMEARGIEIILADDKEDEEETTEIGPDGEVKEKPEPNLTIYNQLRIDSIPGAANPYIEGAVINPEDIEGDYEAGVKEEIAEAEMDPDKMNAVYSTNIILVDLDTDEVIVSRESDKILYPASMSKVLTAICMADYLTPGMMSREYKMGKAEIQKTKEENFSAVGTTPGDVLPVRDLFYGMLVCSGADADYALTKFLAGNEENMVELLNKRAWEMGISDTAHFTNVIGAFDPDHHCTVYDIAVIMSAAVQNPLILDAMSTEQYRTVPTQKNEEGVDISNWFLRRIGTYETNGRVVAAKTGFISEAGFCCVSYLETKSGKHYVCVTANSDGNWRTIFDHISLYRAFTK
jgi:D-alanyl-D-alanine carboxypeptidase